ncbi:MAG TPA: MerR family transcriptional regulator [Pyrinomonadaceae bacterium]|jgi:DNA-binding transcriptional MerR regulator|nr:MerR family transcriptional regulator [Pyrinomonadaceae bacterium]
MVNRATVAIPEKLFFKIGEVCELSGVQAHVLRYWESEFPMLAPQKNRAGQRTYRKRDVEMALRIKELLYDDQYTIAGAKKKLASELRGASKLKVVTPEMAAGPREALAPTAPQSQPHLQRESAPPALSVETQESSSEASISPNRASLTENQRDAVRHLVIQLRDLLETLDAGEDSRKPHGK